MIELSCMQLVGILMTAVSLTTLIVVPLAIRYGIPDKEEN